MARLLGVDYPRAFYHVMSRGNNQENIFKNNRDREKFLEYLGKANEPFSIFIHTYCLMSNHISSIGGNTRISGIRPVAVKFRPEQKKGQEKLQRSG
jgi:REP element-mobilizing transposase RayT